MSINEIMEKYGVSKNFQIIALEDVQYGCIFHSLLDHPSVAKGEIITIIDICTDYPNRVTYFDYNLGEIQHMDTTAKMFLYSDKQ